MGVTQDDRSIRWWMCVFGHRWCRWQLNSPVQTRRCRTCGKIQGLWLTRDLSVGIKDRDLRGG